jgi:hypothetical protein
MALDLSDCQFFGPALPAPFVRFELEKELTSRKLLPKKLGNEGEKLRNFSKTPDIGSSESFRAQP